jgi:hypothetical protein
MLTKMYECDRCQIRFVAKTPECAPSGEAFGFSAAEATKVECPKCQSTEVKVVPFEAGMSRDPNMIALYRTGLRGSGGG